MHDSTNPCKDSGPQVVLITIAPAPAGAVSSVGLPANEQSQAGSFKEDDAMQCSELLNGIVDSGLVADLTGRITAVNERCCELVQMSAGELKGFPLHQLISGADESLMATVSRVLDRKSRVRIEAYVLRKDGSTCPCEIGVGAVTAGGQARALCVIRTCSRMGFTDGGRLDDTETKVSKRIETAATVAGQIAHDFDNLLTPLFAYPELIRRDLPEKCRGRDLLDIMEKTAHDMAKITQQLLALSKRGQNKMAPFNVNEVAQRVAGLLHEMAAERNIEISTNLAPDLLLINGATEQMLRVIQNLCQNAMDAMEGGGRIDIVTRNVYLDRPGGIHGRLDVGEYVELKVIDNGSGIPDSVIDKIFDPFFTTRKLSKSRGSGLGLSVVRGIVDDHKGSIHVESTVGKGTTFTMYFPICREEPQATRVAGSDKGATVLIVDDDVQQRDILSRLFDAHDYKVKCVPSGHMAVGYMAECAAPGAPGSGQSAANRFPDIVVLDVVLDPGMDGKETCKRMLEINPRQRVIMLSGFPAAENTGVKQSVSSVSYLTKPVTWQSISRELLRNGTTAGPDTLSHGLVPCKANRILVVDDEEGIRRLFHMILSSAFPRADIEMAGNGLDAVAAFKDGHHAVIIMDLRMPVMSGEEAFMRMKDHCHAHGWEHPSVVFCTGFAPPDIVRRIAASGEGHSILTKPVSGDALVAAAGEHLSDAI